MKNPSMKNLSQHIQLGRRAIISSAVLLAMLLAVSGPATAQTANASEAMGPTLNKIADSGAIFLAYRDTAIPFSYVNLAAQPPAVVGYTWEICGHVAKAVRERLARDIETVPVAVTANAQTLMLKTGMADLVCGAPTNTVARQKQVAFSNTFFVAEVKAMVNKNSGIRSIADLANKNVVTTLGTTADRLIKQAALANNVTMVFLGGRTHLDSMAMLERGEAAAYIGDDAILAGMRAASKDRDQFVFLDASLSVEPYGIMLPRDDPQFKQLVDDTLVALTRSSELERIYNKWFLAPIPPLGTALDMPMSARLSEVIANPNDRPGY